MVWVKPEMPWGASGTAAVPAAAGCSGKAWRKRPAWDRGRPRPLRGVREGHEAAPGDGRGPRGMKGAPPSGTAACMSGTRLPSFKPCQPRPNFTPRRPAENRHESGLEWDWDNAVPWIRRRFWGATMIRESFRLVSRPNWPSLEPWKTTNHGRVLESRETDLPTASSCPTTRMTRNLLGISMRL